uniref:F-box domain-containing protein n=1 Tax=Sinocyclocheilus anshuiensis TaxID=1608454 RepID=A0A671QYW2_9TELE
YNKCYQILCHSRSKKTLHSYFNCYADVPLAVVEEILLNLPAHQVVRVCRLVCHEWKELVDSAAHWRERIQTPKRKEKFKSPRAEEFQGWNIIQNGHNCWAAHENRRKFPDNRQQLIDLKKEGYSTAFMDQLQPHQNIRYQISVELLDQKKNPISIFQPEKKKISTLNYLCSALFQMTHN